VPFGFFKTKGFLIIFQNQLVAYGVSIKIQKITNKAKTLTFFAFAAI